MSYRESWLVSEETPPAPLTEARFNYLPIRQAADGSFKLCDGAWPEPFLIQPSQRRENAQNRAQVIQELRQHPAVEVFELPTVPQTSTGLALHSVIDFGQRKIWDAQVSVTLLREVETVLRQRQPSDVLHLAGRACGRDSGAQMLAATLALEMAYGVVPPPLAVLARNLAQCAETIANGLYNLFLLAGPDYSEAVVSRTNPAIWRKAQQTPAPGALVHGLSTIAGIMLGLNRMQGHLYSEAWHMLRLTREIATLLFGKYPHPTTLFPGGIGLVVDKEFFAQILSRVNTLLDFTKRATALWNDLVNFLYEAEPGYRYAGVTLLNFLSCGFGDDPAVYDASFANVGHWGEQRRLTPGVVINGHLRTTNLHEVNLGLEEFIEHAYYQPWPGELYASDPLSAPLSPYHPWNKETAPRPQARAWAGAYSWATAPRWDREVVETGPLAQLWVTALADLVESDFIGVTGSGLEIELPKFQSPALRLQWQRPACPNTLERLRARAVQTAYHTVVAFELLLKAFDCLRHHSTALAAPYVVPRHALGVGFWEGARGVAWHHLSIEQSKIANYQINTPLNWLASPRDCYGAPGVLETALMNTPLLEEFTDLANFKGIDLLRTIHAFDP